MKQTITKSILVLIGLFMAGTALSQTPSPSNTQNYVLTFTPRISGLTTDAAIGILSSNPTQVQTSIQYIDGLGRPLQTVQVKGNPGATNDVIQPIAYDAFGRMPTKYLPYTNGSSTPGSYRPDALTGTNGYNNSAQIGFYQPQTGQNYTPMSVPSASTGFEPSPLNRIVEQGATGANWQLGNHTNKILYASNDGTTYWSKQFGVNIDATTGARTLIDQGSYGANQLSVIVTQNENWTNGQSDVRLNTTEEYKDNEGHLLLKRTYNYNTNSSTVETLSTYYVYDDLGNLCYVLPPKAEADGGLNSLGNSAVITNLCYQYTYDSRNRLVQKKLPGKGWEFMIYNLIDQPIMTQDANQRNQSPQQWSFVKYDGQGRPVITGTYAYPGSSADNNLSAPDQTEFNWLQNYAASQTNIWEVRDNSTATGYSNQACPQGATVTLTINYYDDYTFSNNPYSPTASGTLTNPNGLLTATRTAVLNSDGSYGPMLWAVYYYENLGRLTQSFKQHYLGGNYNTSNYDNYITNYNFDNSIANTTRFHYVSGNQALTVNNGYSYDHMGRKIQTTEAIASGTGTLPSPIILSKIDYNEVGQAMTKHLHSADNGNSFLQHISYLYNERGWLTNSTSSLFALQLNYNINATTGPFNGNISSQDWSTAGGATNHYYYTYDVLNRLSTGTSSIGFNETGPGGGDIVYDKLGNIMQLSRTDPSSGTSNFTYNYSPGTNLLQSVGGSNFAGNSYVYDNNGNMSHDARNNTDVYYNILNLPRSEPGKNLSYTYDANGRKLNKYNGTTSTDYIDGIQYDNNSITFIQTEEGRVLNLTGTPNYEYSLTDHLGNTRVTFDSYTGSGSGSPKQTDDYYPFGLEISGLVSGTRTEYLYNKKEKQEETNNYDYGARFYDPVIARWTAIDPLAEKTRRFTPYAYCNDSPIIFTDPDGMFSSGMTHDFNESDMLGGSSQDGEMAGSYGGLIVDGSVDRVEVDKVLKDQADEKRATEEGQRDAEKLYKDVMSGKIGANQGGDGPGPKQPPADNSSFWPHLIGPGMIAAGQPFLSKAFITPGASAGTSIASKVLTKMIPLKSSVRLWSPVIRDEGLEWVGTKVVGRFLGRWVPWVGWGLTAYDIYDNRQAIGAFLNDMQKENEQHKDDLLWHVH